MYKQMIFAVASLGLAGPAFAQFSNSVNERYASPLPAAATGELNPAAHVPGYSHLTPTMKRQRVAQAMQLRDFVEQRKLANGGGLTEADHQEIARRYKRIVASW
ncbi:hypothetical protein [Sphingomonas sp. T9W2]|uniref:hypothetical protein n=1 Tax=Sphingomonas sp. T9W2 TaxID=3143183 RepID=UPI0031F48A5A